MKPSGCRETVGRLHLFHAIKAVCHSQRFIHDILSLLCDVHLLARYHSQRFILSVCSAVFIENVHRIVMIDDACPGGSPPVSMMPEAVPLSLCPAMPAAPFPLAMPLSAYGCVRAGLVSLSLCHDFSLSCVPTVSPAAILVTRLQQGRLYNTHEKFSGG